MSELFDHDGFGADFKPVSLSEIAHVEMGQSPDSRYVFEDPDIGYPFLQGNAEFSATNPIPKFGCARPAKLAKTNDVLISVRAPVGAINIADRAYCIGRGLAAICVNGIKPSLAAHFISYQSPSLKRVAQGTTFEAISKNDLLDLNLRMPPDVELGPMAQIFDTLDTAIQKTEAIVEKLKQVKQGLLHDLLTRGINANGELRPSYEQAPHLYKESPLGWIPREWRLSKVGEEFDIQLGKMLDVRKNAGEMKPYLGNKSVQWDRVDLDETQLVALSRSDKERFRLKSGDLLVCEGGEVGRAAIWDAPIDECYYQKALHRLRPMNEFNSRLLLEFLRYWTSRDLLSEFVSRTSIAHLTQEKLANVPLPVPQHDEQERLVSEMLAHKRRLENEEVELSKLIRLKSGLMDDLLTGRVRVTPLLAQSQ
ncbi:MAG: restriction endonuclease subunit S [Methylomonas sp.]